MKTQYIVFLERGNLITLFQYNAKDISEIYDFLYLDLQKLFNQTLSANAKNKREIVINDAVALDGLQDSWFLSVNVNDKVLFCNIFAQRGINKGRYVFCAFVEGGTYCSEYFAPTREVAISRWWREELQYRIANISQFPKELSIDFAQISNVDKCHNITLIEIEENIAHMKCFCIN